MGEVSKNDILPRIIKNSTFAAVIKKVVIMYSSSDFEHLFIRHKAEGVPQGESIFR